MAQKLSDVAERVAWLLKKVWNGSQTKMAADIGVSQSVVSHVMVGRQEPGRKLLAAVASNQLINSKWLITGEGDPLIVQTTESGRRALYVALNLFEGPPEEHGECLGRMLEVPMRHYRPSRYWVEIPEGCPLIDFDSLKIATGDFVLFESDAENWPANLIGHPCIVRRHGELQFDYVVRQHGKKITTSRIVSTHPKMSADGKHFRVFSLPNEEIITTPKLKKLLEVPIAIGLFRQGGFGRS